MRMAMRTSPLKRASRGSMASVTVYSSGVAASPSRNAGGSRGAASRAWANVATRSATQYQAIRIEAQHTSSAMWTLAAGGSETRALFEPANGEARALFICAPGAGGEMNDPNMRRTAERLRAIGLDVVRFNFRPLHIGRIILRMMVIILEHSHYVLHFCVRNEHDANPMVNHPARTADLLSILPRFQSLHPDFAVLQRFISRRPLALF